MRSLPCPTQAIPPLAFEPQGSDSISAVACLPAALSVMVMDRADQHHTCRAVTRLCTTRPMPLVGHHTCRHLLPHPR